MFEGKCSVNQTVNLKWLKLSLPYFVIIEML